MRHMKDVLWGLVHDSTWNRLVTIQTGCAEEIMEAIRRTFGREAEITAARNNGYGVTINTLRLVISRLEETELTDLIMQIDVEAVVDAVPAYGREMRRGRWKRHTKSDLPDVSKYGNELSD
ncbi:hypothetical protein [Paenibacillus sp. 32352]|uniref:hypothetical protein n=1 Tax=Paenibacillus sp. 32352 TaxID=1969111 RepID=UPI0009ACB333|nr:hypothetical protein [Paenibacillus sp. 32352]